MKRLLSILFLAATLFTAAAQDYVVPEIKVSQDKVRVNGEAFYAHVVQEKQTLFSIARAYSVSVQDIYDANKNLNLESEGLKTGQVLLIPVEKKPAAPAKLEGEVTGDARALFPGIAGQAGNDGKGGKAGDDTAVMPGGDRASDDFVLEIPETVHIALILPFSAGGRARENCLDFYCGALLAAKKYGEAGKPLVITALDCKDPGTNLSPRALDEFDVIIGPSDTADTRRILKHLPHDKYLVSPLEPRNAVFAKDWRLVQAPSPVSVQNEEAARWAASEMAPGDSLVLIREKDKPLTPANAALVKALRASGVRYHTISYALLEGLEIQTAFMAHAAAEGRTTRYLIASEDESFINDAVRNVNLMLYKHYDVALYAPSRVSRFSTIEPENLHNVNTHLCATYFTDYTNDECKKVVLAYRALFNSEPGQFALHGYDVVNYFAGICSTYGKQWAKKLCDYPARGLQTSFRFAPFDGAGQVNTSVIRVVYTPDFKLVIK